MQTIKHSEWMAAVRMAARWSKKSALDISRMASGAAIQSSYEAGEYLVVTPNWKSLIRSAAWSNCAHELALVEDRDLPSYCWHYQCRKCLVECDDPEQLDMEEHPERYEESSPATGETDAK